MELAAGFFSSVPIPALLLLIFCMIGILNSGKINETLALLVGVIISYILLLEYGPTPFTKDINSMKDSIQAIPFLNNLLHVSGAPGLTGLFQQDLNAFMRQLLNLLLLSMTVSVILTVSQPLADSCKSLPSVLSFLIPWFVRYAACVLGMWGYVYFSVYVLSVFPKEIMTIFAYLILLTMLLMLLSPLAEFILLSAHVTSNPVVQAISRFVQEYKMGGVLQTTFFCTFLLVLLAMVLQDTGVLNLSVISLEYAQ